MRLFLFYSFIFLYFIQASVIDIKNFQSSVYLIDKRAFGINLPLLSKKLVNWGQFHKNELIVFRNKSGLTCLGKVLNLPNEIIIINEKRSIVPFDYAYVLQLSNMHQKSENISGFIHKKNVLGKVIL